MFKNKNDRVFSRIYLWLTFSSLFIFIVCLGTSAYLLSELPFLTAKTTGVILAIVSLIAFGFCLTIIFTGRKRYIAIIDRRKQEKNQAILDSYLKGSHHLNIFYVIVNDSTGFKNGSQLEINEAEITFENLVLPWSMIASPEYVMFNGLWFISLGKEKYRGDHWNGILLLSVPEAIKIVEHYLVPIDETQFRQTEAEQTKVVKSEIVWGKNRLLFWERIVFITLSFLIPLLMGLIISLKFKLETLGTVFSTGLSVILIVGVYPWFFARGIKNNYFISKIGIGYAWGRKSFFIPWDNIYSLEVINRKILIRYHFENESQTDVGILKIKYNARVIKEIKKINNEYLTNIRILDD
ncbi:MAG TPA: hypothetical protein PKC96_07525 [Bacilli bacterium]|nr:hypothetical protein [Bacilli bacterium]